MRMLTMNANTVYTKKTPTHITFKQLVEHQKTISEWGQNAYLVCANWSKGGLRVLWFRLVAVDLLPNNHWISKWKVTLLAQGATLKRCLGTRRVPSGFLCTHTSLRSKRLQLSMKQNKQSQAATQISHGCQAPRGRPYQASTALWDR